MTGVLLRAMDTAQSPTAVRALNWALERVTGKSVVASGSTVTLPAHQNWLERNGYVGLAGLGGGYSTTAGVTISSDKALSSPVFYACTKIISEDMGSLPFFTYRRSKDHKSVEKAYDHPLWQTLKNLVNPYTSTGEFVEAMTAHACLAGNGYARIERTGSLVRLWLWQPEDVRMDRDSRGIPYYLHRDGHEWKTYAHADVFHLRGMTFDGLTGDNTASRARQTIGLTLATQEYASRYFANDATPGIVIRRPVLSAGQAPWGAETVKRIKDAWKEWHQGLANSHEPAVLQDGAEVQVLTPHAEESQLVEQRKFQVIECCRIFRMPPHKLADLDRATFANIEHLAIEYIQHTLSPWQRRWREAVYRCLLTTDEQLADQIYSEHDVNALQKGDFATQSEGFRKLLEKGVYSINEVRRWMNLNPVDGGDEHFIQLNLATVQDVAAGATLSRVGG